MGQDGRVTGRIYYLDSLRAFVMSFGVVLHAGMLDRFWFSNLVSETSGLFRMKLFVFIAGFFAVLLSDRRGVAAVQKERIVRFGLPCAVLIVFLNPVANIYMYRLLEGPLAWRDYLSFDFRWPVGTPERINWHLHLWFLIVVLAYCLALPLFIRAMEARPVARSIAWLTDRERRESLMVLLVAGIMTLALVGGRTLHFIAFQRPLQDGPLNFLVQAILWYWPYFLLGVAAFRHQSLFRLLHRTPWWQLGLATIAYFLCHAAAPMLLARYGRAAAEAVKHLGEGFAGYYFAMLLLGLFARFLNFENRTIRFLSDASYTVYLFHFAFIAILGYHLMQAGLTPLAMYLLTIPTVYLACLALHRWVIDATPLPRLIFNGKRTPPGAAPARGANASVTREAP